MNLKRDKYKNARGGESRLFKISCIQCGIYICLYQKDGPGVLLRLYRDRISEAVVPTMGQFLQCPNNHLIGTNMIYAKEDRPAFRLAGQSIKKGIVK